MRGETMIIVSGKIHVRPGARHEFLTSSRDAVVQARRARGCRDFVVAADPIEPDRVNVYEEWESEDALLTFRGAGPDEGLTSSIVRADVARHVVASSGPP
jgi:quinol monooxygenase YgiN